MTLLIYDNNYNTCMLGENGALLTNKVYSENYSLRVNN